MRSTRSAAARIARTRGGAPRFPGAAGKQVPRRAVPLNQPVERGAVALCEPRRFREVAARPHHDAREVAPVEAGQQTVAGGRYRRLHGVTTADQQAGRDDEEEAVHVTLPITWIWQGALQTACCRNAGRARAANGAS